jgi:hypothetical protein
MSTLEKNALVSRFKFSICQICTFMKQYRDKTAVQGLKQYMTRYLIQFLISKLQKHLKETELLVYIMDRNKITYLSSQQINSILKFLYCYRKAQYCNTFPTVFLKNAKDCHFPRWPPTCPKFKKIPFCWLFVVKIQMEYYNILLSIVLELKFRYKINMLLRYFVNFVLLVR